MKFAALASLGKHNSASPDYLRKAKGTGGVASALLYNKIGGVTWHCHDDRMTQQEAGQEDAAGSLMKLHI